MRLLAERYPIHKLHMTKLKTENFGFLKRWAMNDSYTLYDNFFFYEAQQLLQKVIFYLDYQYTKSTHERSTIREIKDVEEISVGFSTAVIHSNIPKTKQGITVVLTLLGHSWYESASRDYITILGERGIPHADVFYHFKSAIADGVHSNFRKTKMQLSNYKIVNYSHSILLSKITLLISLLNLTYALQYSDNPNEKSFFSKQIVEKRSEYEKLKSLPLQYYPFNENERHAPEANFKALEEGAELKEDDFIHIKEENLNQFVYIKDLGNGIEGLKKKKEFDTFVKHVEDVFSYLDDEKFFLLKMVPLFKKYLPALQQALMTLNDLQYKEDKDSYEELNDKVILTLNYLNHWLETEMQSIYSNKKEKAIESLDSILSDFNTMKLDRS